MGSNPHLSARGIAKVNCSRANLALSIWKLVADSTQLSRMVGFEKTIISKQKDTRRLRGAEFSLPNRDDYEEYTAKNSVCSHLGA